MRFYESLNETQGLADLLAEVKIRYSDFTDAPDGSEKPWEVVKTAGIEARFDNRFGLPPEIRRYVAESNNELIRCFQTASLWRDDNSNWPRARQNPDISASISSHANRVELFLYGIINDGRGENYGPGYFSGYSLFNTALMPNIFTDDIALQAMVPSNRKGPYADRIFKTLWMLKNTLDETKNPTITWMVPVRKMEPSLINQYYQAIVGAKNVRSVINGYDGELSSKAMSAIVNGMLPLNLIRYQYGNPTTWTLAEDGGPGISYAENDGAQAAQLRSWANELPKFMSQWNNGIVWQDLWDEKYNSGFDDMEDILLPERLLERLDNQQSRIPKDILNQPL